MQIQDIAEAYDNFKKKASACVLCRERGLIDKQDGKWAFPLFQKKFPSNYLGALFVLQNPNVTDTYNSNKGYITCDSRIEKTDQTGKALFMFLDYVGLSLDNIIVTNSVLCLPKRRDDKNEPTSMQVENCKINFRMLIDSCIPRVVVTFGKICTEKVDLMLGIPRDDYFYGRVGNIREIDGVKFIASSHPSVQGITTRGRMCGQGAPYYEEGVRLQKHDFSTIKSCL